MKIFRLAVWICFVSTGVLAACVASDYQPAVTPSPSAPFSTAVATAEEPWQSFEPARIALAQMLHTTPEQIEPLRYEPTEFPNGCLDLPHFAEMCTDEIVSGYRVWFKTPQGERIAHLNADGTQFRFVESAVNE